MIRNYKGMELLHVDNYEEDFNTNIGKDFHLSAEQSLLNDLDHLEEHYTGVMEMHIINAEKSRENIFHFIVVKEDSKKLVSYAGYMKI